jgi:multicomponent Na+:H+ antiporter subunit G
MTMSTLQAAVVAAFVVIGSFFLFVGTVGLLRLPDVYNRMHATSKATTLGAASIFLAGFVYFVPEGAALTSLVGILFLFLTTPTGAHMISRSAQKMGVPLAMDATWPGGEPSLAETAGEGDEVSAAGETGDEPAE